MPKIQTITDLANKALGSIGLQIIASIDQTDDEKARICRLFIYDTIEDIQDRFNWPELETTVTLSRNATDSPEGLPQWTLPKNYLHMVRVVNYLPNRWTESGKLLTVDITEDQPKIVYIRNDENAAKFGNNLYKAIWTQLAAEIAPALVQDEAATAKAENKAAKAWTQATGKAVVKRRSAERTARGTSWNNSRRGSSWTGDRHQTVTQ